MEPFEVGDIVHMTLLPPGVADVEVTGIGTCGDDHDGTPCPKPTITYLDPQSGEEDEAHAEDFAKV